jgi:hypothetical protein
LEDKFEVFILYLTHSYRFCWYFLSDIMLFLLFLFEFLYFFFLELTLFHIINILWLWNIRFVRKLTRIGNENHINPFATSGSYMSHSKLFVNMKMFSICLFMDVPFAICPFYDLSFLWPFMGTLKRGPKLCHTIRDAPQLFI